MMARISRFSVYLLLLIFLLAGCSEIGRVLAPGDPAPTNLPTATNRPAFSTPVPTQPARQPGIIRIWLPPQFEPLEGNPAGELMRARLNAFTDQNPGLQIEVRVKPLTGAANLIDSLSLASAAAPLTLPDLVILPNGDMDAAALKGLIRPLDDLTSLPDDPDWYPFARQLSRLQNSTFGIPFAGDALVLVYRPALVGQLDADWETISQRGIAIALPASDPNALLALSLYQSTGALIVNEQGRPSLDQQLLTEVFDFYRQAGQSGLFPFYMTQYETDTQSWQVFQEQRTHAVITWASRYLASPPVDASAIPLPGLRQGTFTMAKGWVWAVASTDPDQQELAVALAEFLVEPRFQAEWTSAAGLIPVRPSALLRWNTQILRTLAGDAANAAHLVPPSDLQLTLGPLLLEGVVKVLKEQASPAEAAQSAIERLK